MMEKRTNPHDATAFRREESKQGKLLALVTRVGEMSFSFFYINHTDTNQLWVCMGKGIDSTFLWICYTALWCSRSSSWGWLPSHVSEETVFSLHPLAVMMWEAVGQENRTGRKSEGGKIKRICPLLLVWLCQSYFWPRGGGASSSVNFQDAYTTVNHLRFILLNCSSGVFI